MAMKPPIYKLQCPKCGNSKIVDIKSDCLTPQDAMAMSTTCSVCKSTMQRVELTLFDKFFKSF